VRDLLVELSVDNMQVYCMHINRSHSCDSGFFNLGRVSPEQNLEPSMPYDQRLTTLKTELGAYTSIPR
jgi:hypothetical protein